jgi:uroporphyrin-III C-methyltransferase
MSNFSRILEASAELALPAFAGGTVWLAGAGPGDPGLLTLHVLHALRQAEIIVYDALVSDGVLNLAPAETRREFAGKRGGQPSASQVDISERLVALAREGKRVLRLKGGDPFVFGRGSEEALALARAGIPFRILPGITAGLAALAYAGIPATTRDTNHAVILATGHYAPQNEPGLDWTVLARTGLPIILYMAMTHLEEIATALMAAGVFPDHPVAVISDATTPRQRVMVSSLARVKSDVDEQGFVAPAIVAIGEIVRLRAALAPFAIRLEMAP